MADCWDYFHVIAPSKDFVYQTDDIHFSIDDWWDEAIGHFVNWKTNGYHFDAVVCNYAFFSKIFDFIPNSSLKVLDTHDRLSDRREMLEKHSISPEFFYTTKEQEQIALDRANLVLAIKQEEADFFDTLTSVDVRTLGHLEPRNFKDEAEPKRAVGSKLRVGFLGSANSINTKNLERFFDEISSAMLSVEDIVFEIAGSVCEALPVNALPASIVFHGRVESVEDFYQQVDLIFVPFEFSTGLKIKLIEALSYGKPVLSTSNASEGVPAKSKWHLISSYSEMWHVIQQVARKPELLVNIEAESRALFESAHEVTSLELDRLYQLISGRNLVVIDELSSENISLENLYYHNRLYCICQELRWDFKIKVYCRSFSIDVWRELVNDYALIDIHPLENCGDEAVTALQNSSFALAPMDTGEYLKVFEKRTKGNIWFQDTRVTFHNEARPDDLMLPSLMTNNRLVNRSRSTFWSDSFGYREKPSARKTVAVVLSNCQEISVHEFIFSLALHCHSVLDADLWIVTDEEYQSQIEDLKYLSKTEFVRLLIIEKYNPSLIIFLDPEAEGDTRFESLALSGPGILIKSSSSAPDIGGGSDDSKVLYFSALPDIFDCILFARSLFNSDKVEEISSVFYHNWLSSYRLSNSAIIAIKNSLKKVI